MWKYVKFGLGILLILMSFSAILSLTSGQVEETGRQIAQNGVTVDGVIKERIKHTVVAKRGRVGGAGWYYSIKYSFTTLEGKTYSDEINVSKGEAYKAEDGQTIRVRYYANDPQINSPLGYREYMTEEDAADVPIGAFIFSSLLFFCGGAWLVYSNARRIWPESDNATVQDRLRAADASGDAAAVSGYVKKESGDKPLFGG